MLKEFKALMAMPMTVKRLEDERELLTKTLNSVVEKELKQTALIVKRFELFDDMLGFLDEWVEAQEDVELSACYDNLLADLKTKENIYLMEMEANGEDLG